MYLRINTDGLNSLVLIKSGLQHLTMIFHALNVSLLTSGSLLLIDVLVGKNIGRHLEWIRVQDFEEETL